MIIDLQKQPPLPSSNSSPITLKLYFTPPHDMAMNQVCSQHARNAWHVTMDPSEDGPYLFWN